MYVRVFKSKLSAALLKLLIALLFLQISDNSHAFAQTEQLDTLFEELQDPENSNWERTEEAIWKEWSRSGSDAMDYLLERGRAQMVEGNIPRAIEHFSSLIDHAPEFAEGWNARATAFFMIEEYGLSMADIRETLLRNPRHFGALAGMAQILEQTNQPERALEVAKRALALHPHSETIKANVARLEKQVGGTAL